VKPKPSTSQRGYGYLHQQLRERLRPMVEAGMVRCPRCGQFIEGGDRWELDHAPGKRGYLGPSHFRCNRSAGGKIGAAITNGKRRRVSRIW
jgi:hypothetical protein